MTNPINTGSPERRAEVVAGIRALADLIEGDTTLPVPTSVGAQFSLLGDLTEEGRRLVRDVAAHLGLPAERHMGEQGAFGVSDDRASLNVQVAGGYTRADGSFRIVYTIHGRRKAAEGGEPS